MNVTSDILYVGVRDRRIDLFEGQYRVPQGMSYNSYLIRDEKIAVLDTVDAAFTHEWLDNLSAALAGRAPDYLIVQHMEPDHSANVKNFMKVYPDATLVGNAKTFQMLANFFGPDLAKNTLTVADGDSLCLGRHQLTFVFAPMVHWPEVMVTYDAADKVLFSADGFGRFGVPEAEGPWEEEARRYYFGIVGKYGAQVQALLKKAQTLDFETVCPLHGPVLREDDLYKALHLYDVWSSYRPETEGVCLAYTSVYGNTKKAAETMVDKRRAGGAPVVEVFDLARCDLSRAVAAAFRYPKLVLATTTYNADVFPFMRTFLEALAERGFKSRTVGLIENGSWAPQAAKVMRRLLEPCKDLTFAEPTVSIRSAVSKENGEQLTALARELCREYEARSPERANKNDLTALFRIGYGLYVVTTNDGKRDNGLIVNTVTQVSDNPNRVAVNINKANYSHHIVKQTGILNVNCLSVDAPFSVFECFGFRSGRNADKFEGWEVTRSDNGLVILPRYINAAISLKVEDYVDLGSHGMFICSVTEARVMSDRDTMTYTYYQQNVKPKPQTQGKKGWVCKICGYIYEGETLPEDFVCPLCKHGAQDFEPIK